MATKRLIDVCAEIRKIEAVLAERKEQAGSLTYKVFEAVKTALEKAPTVDAVEVVHGRWIPSDIDIDEYEQCMSDANDWYDWECSVCHYQMSYVYPVQRKHLTNYCPNCGAKMDGDGNG